MRWSISWINSRWYGERLHDILAAGNIWENIKLSKRRFMIEYMQAIGFLDRN